MSTAYHARYFAYELTRQRPSDAEDDVLLELTDLDDLEDDYVDEELVDEADAGSGDSAPLDATAAAEEDAAALDLARLEAEIAELEGFIGRAHRIPSTPSLEHF